MNNQGGSIPTYAPLATPAAEFSVNYINKYLGGIDGHPLKLQECFVKNAEEEGLHCGEEFLSNKNVVGVLYGAVAVGANSINSTIAGKKPIIEMYNLNPSDQSNKNTYLLYGSGSFAVYGWGTFGAKVLHAKTGAILYPESPGNEQGAAGMAQAMKAAGIKTKLVGFAADATDLTGALTAAGGQNVDMIGTYAAAASQCINFYKAVQQLGISPEKVVTFQECVTPQIQAALGGKLPKVYLGVAQSADDLTTPLTPVGKAFIKALETAYGSNYKNQAADPWYPRHLRPDADRGRVDEQHRSQERESDDARRSGQGLQGPTAPRQPSHPLRKVPGRAGSLCGRRSLLPVAWERHVQVSERLGADADSAPEAAARKGSQLVSRSSHVERARPSGRAQLERNVPWIR